MRTVRTFGSVFTIALACSSGVFAQQPAPARPATAPAPAPVVAPQKTGTPAPEAIKPPEDYVIGTDDVLTVSFWREKDLSTDVIVRPDGKITLPLINDIYAAGLTPDQLREKVLAEAGRYVEDPSPTVFVKQINSRKIFITGEVAKQGTYALTSPTTVLQLIAMAGGLQEFARKKDIMILRMEAGRQVTFTFDYGAVMKRKKLEQNIFLKPGDTIVVP
jgi:polysaccharide export outer membrane protein